MTAPQRLHLLRLSWLLFFLCTAANFSLGHWGLQWNLGKLGLGAALLGSLPWALARPRPAGRPLTLPWAFLGLWCLLLAANVAFSLAVMPSAKLALRMFALAALAWALGQALRKPGGAGALAWALLASWPPILGLIAAQSAYPQAFKGLEGGWIENYLALENQPLGLYINPNEMGWAMVHHGGLMAFLMLRKSLPPALWAGPFALGGFLAWGSGSRNAALAWVLLGLMLLWARRRAGGPVPPAFWLKLGGLSLGLLALAALALPELRATLALAWNLPDIWAQGGALPERFWASLLGQRLEVWGFGLRWLEKHPWMGLGLGAFNYHSYGHKMLNLHSLPYGILVEQGILGLAAALGLAWALVHRAADRTNLPLLVFLVGAQLLDDLKWSYAFYAYLALGLGMLLAGRAGETPGEIDQN